MIHLLKVFVQQFKCLQWLKVQKVCIRFQKTSRYSKNLSVQYITIVSVYVECCSLETEVTIAIPNAGSYMIYVISPECIVPSCEPSHIQLF